MNTTPILRATNIVKKLGGKTILNDVSLDVHKGDVKVVIGPSGAGKSTFLQCLNYLLPPDSGDIWLEGKKVNARDTRELCALRQQVGMIFQDFNLLDTFSIHLRPRIFRKLQHHIAKVTGLTQADLDKGEPIVQGLRRFMQWCGPDAEFAEWGMDDVPVLKQNLYLCNIDESKPTIWYDLQQVFLREHPRKEGEGMTLESVVTRLGLPMERQFHDALSDTLYTADVCRMLDLRAGLAAYPTEEESLRASLCPTPGDYRDFEVFRGYVEQYTWRTDPKIYTMSCPECGAPLKPDDVWLKKGSNSWYTLSQCPHCAGSSNAAGKGVFQRYKLARRDGLHWSYARCLQIPDDASLARWEKQRTAQLERMKARAEKQAAE